MTPAEKVKKKKKSKREAISEVQVFSPRCDDQFILEVSTQDSQVKYISLTLYYLRTRYYFYFQFKTILLKF